MRAISLLIASGEGHGEMVSGEVRSHECSGLVFGVLAPKDAAWPPRWTHLSDRCIFRLTVSSRECSQHEPAWVAKLNEKADPLMKLCANPRANWKDCAQRPLQVHHTLRVIAYAAPAWRNRSSAWWCAQRTYFTGIKHMLSRFAHASFYLLVDADTKVSIEAAHDKVDHLRASLPAEADVYRGDIAEMPVRPLPSSTASFVMTGGGALLRGTTLRRLNSSGAMARCSAEQWHGMFYWWHLDWVLAECLAQIHVTAVGDPDFRQQSSPGSGRGGCKVGRGASVTCHGVATAATAVTYIAMADSAKT